ncbi:MAG: hypothetical protein HPY62_12980, partial [Bacteroidales bacterium]|nr:hypothetical protein [Bacteroidales bacterium]
MMKRFALILSSFSVLFLVKGYLSIHAQKINPLIITERFNDYVRNSPREEMYLHLDRYYYIAGEDIWFSMYCFDRASGNLSVKSLIAYVELLNPWNVPVLQARFSLTSGRGEGYLLLPDTLSCGKYTIRAYTNWMKNFLPQNCFMQDLEICNAIKETDFFNKQYSDPDERLLKFYPEGGNLINGTANKVAVKSTFNAENKVNYQGIIVTDTRDTVAGFTIPESGYGVFSLIPETGKQYYAVFNGESVSLPPASEEKISLRVDSVSEDLTELGLNFSPHRSFSSDKKFFMVIRNMGKIMLIREISVSDIVNKITIPVAEIKPGINHAVLLSDEGEVLSERLFYLPEKESLDLTAAFDTVYRRREKVIVNTDESGTTYGSMLSDVSISVAPALFSGSLKGIKNYMIFASEFGILPDSDKNNSAPDPVLTDNFLLCSSSSWINWRDILSSLIESKRYEFEDDGHHLSLSLRYRNSNAIDSAKFIYMSVQGKVAEFDYAKRDRNGRYTFVLPVDARLRSLVIQPENANDNMVLEAEQPYPRIYNMIQTVRSPLSASQIEVFSAAGFNYQVEKIYKNTLKQEVQASVSMDSKRRRFYGIPEMEVLLDDYISLPDMLEVFFELVPGIILRQGRSGYEMKITNPLTGSFYE